MEEEIVTNPAAIEWTAKALTKTLPPIPTWTGHCYANKGVDRMPADSAYAHVRDDE